MSKPKHVQYFGTDGIRGQVGQHPIDAQFMLKLGWAVGREIIQQGGRKAVIGKDTRLSGYMLETALESGLSAAGVNVRLLGPMPTPGIAYLTRTLRATVGVVISASHNAFQDNGVKFFSRDGFKLPDEFQTAIEKRIDEPFVTAAPNQLGKAKRVTDAAGRYIEFCKSAIPHHTTLKGLKIVLDCANGATYHIAPSVFRELGADVSCIATEPNGLNINDQCGSTHPEKLINKVLTNGADLGIAFDGDGDRVVMVDHKGNVVDGDELLYIIAKDYKNQGILDGGAVGTVMSNLGIEIALKSLDIPFARSKVGDRYVLAMMKEKGWVLGGESSGHLISLKATTTGDGIISALQVLQALINTNQSLEQARGEIIKFPQTMINVRLENLKKNTSLSGLDQKVQQIEKALGAKGRVLLRPSGTEPVIRVMVEGENETRVAELAQDLANEVTKNFN